MNLFHFIVIGINEHRYMLLVSIKILRERDREIHTHKIVHKYTEKK